MSPVSGLHHYNVFLLNYNLIKERTTSASSFNVNECYVKLQNTFGIDSEIQLTAFNNIVCTFTYPSTVGRASILLYTLWASTNIFFFLDLEK